MGWSDCGKDSKGRPIGYSHAARCDHGCGNHIDRGLSYACGEMHGQLEYGCEGYFCPEHLVMACVAPGEYKYICTNCYDEMEAMSEANAFLGRMIKEHASEETRESALKEIFSTFRECPGEAPAILESASAAMYSMPVELIVAFGMAANVHLGRNSKARKEFCEIVLEHFEQIKVDREQVLGIFR